MLHKPTHIQNAVFHRDKINAMFLSMTVMIVIIIIILTFSMRLIRCQKTVQH